MTALTTTNEVVSVTRLPGHFGRLGARIARLLRRAAEWLRPSPRPKWSRVSVSNGEWCSSVYTSHPDQALAALGYGLAAFEESGDLEDTTKAILPPARWGQLEKPSAPTNYIPTTGGEADRKGD